MAELSALVRLVNLQSFLQAVIVGLVLYFVLRSRLIKILRETILELEQRLGIKGCQNAPDCRKWVPLPYRRSGDRPPFPWSKTQAVSDEVSGD